MGNQLAATPTVDLANVSRDLELLAPLGAEGRNYFATFHCLSYTHLSAGTSAAARAHAAPSPLRGAGDDSSTMDNSPGYTTDFYSADGSVARAEYRTNSLYYPSSTSSPSAAGNGSNSSPLTGGGGGPQGRGRGGGALAALSARTTIAPTTRVSAHERAAWHQARWRQRLPVAARPWRVTPAVFVSEATQDRCPANEAMDRWCRDSTAASSGYAHDGGGRRFFDARGGDGLTSPVPSSYASASFNAGAGRGATTATIASSADIDSTVAGVVGEWRGNYGNYVQLLLRGGGSASHTLTSAALCEDQVIQVSHDPTRGAVSHIGAAGATGVAGAAGGGYGPRSAFTAAMSMTTSYGAGSTTAAAAPQSQSYVLHDVVTKVFVRTQDDPGQTYFLKRVQQMMANAGEQLSVIDSTLPSTTPRNCLWYSMVYEGDGFCVLQRPYVAFTLRERLTARPGMTATGKLFVAFQLLQAVAHLHETYGLTHGDIKPNNVLVQSTGVVVLCDMAPFKPWRLPLDSPLLFDYYYDTDESRACYVAPEKFSDQPLPTPPLESKTPGNATYNVGNLNFDGHTAAMDVFSTACVILFLYGEEDPFTLSEMLSLHHLTTTEARTKAIAPVLHSFNVPGALRPLLLWMLCSASTERPSAREVLTRGLAEGVFPACFAFLYLDVWPRLLTQSSEVRLRLLQNQLPTILQHCVALDASAAEEVLDKDSDEASVADAATFSFSAATAVCILLPLLLQTIHATDTSDEATFRGLLCLRQCVPHCPFTTLTDVVLPHLAYVVNNDAHVYGTATRLLAIRLLCSVAETIARHLTTPKSTTQSERKGAMAGGNENDVGLSADEEQWALMEHLVLPCLYDVLRQSEEEATAVLVELAERLPRLLLLTRFLTERRQVLYGAADALAQTASDRQANTSAGGGCGVSRETRNEKEVDGVRLVLSQPSSTNARTADGKTEEKVAAAAAQTTAQSTPLRSASSNATLARCESEEVAVMDRETQRQPSAVVDAPAVEGANDSSHSTTAAAREAAPRSPSLESEALNLPGGTVAGAGQYLAQMRCLLTNGWNMLQVLYNSSSVVVAATMMRQTTSNVAAFLGEERVTEDLIPLLTTALAAPLRVLRLLFPQAILLHALLQRPQAKTLRLFVEEGLRHPDHVCLKATLDSMAVVVRSRRVPIVESMGLVHQSLPFLMDARLWLREAACGVVEAAAQCYPPSVIALHLEYAVRPLLTHPVPLSQLRRFAASIIRSELAVTSPFGAHHTGLQQRGGDGGRDVRRGAYATSAAWSLLDDAMSAQKTASDFFVDDGPASLQLHHVAATGDGGRVEGGGFGPSWRVDYRDVLPAVVSSTTTTVHAASFASAGPALLHTLPPLVDAPAAMPVGKRDGDAAEVEANEALPLTYALSVREAARLAKELDGDDNESSPLLSTSVAAPAPLSASASRARTFTSLVMQRQHDAAAPPHPIDLRPLPTTLAPHSSICRCGAPVLSASGGRDAPHLNFSFSSPKATRSPSFGAGTAAGFASSAQQQHAAGITGSSTAAAIPPTRSAVLRPVAMPLCSLSAHMGAVYTAAAAPTANGVVVTAGARGEAMIWRVGATTADAEHTRDLSLVERVVSPLASGAATSAHPVMDVTYVASQWMEATPLRRDGNAGAAPGTANTLALASTDGVVRVLDVERNAWLWSTAVGGGDEGSVTALALHDRRSLLITTAAGGVHVVDTRCRGNASVVEDRAASLTAASGAGDHTTFRAAWTARVRPLDGAPSCLVPLYAGDRACAAAVATYGGVVCLYDLRYQLCAQRTTVWSQPSGKGTSAASVLSSLSPSMVSITSACVDPLSSLCCSCRAASWEASVPGPSLLLGTTSGAVYRLLLQSNQPNAYWMAFQARSSVRCMLAQPFNGGVFTGADDGYIRHWSTDRPETSHTMHCVPFASPPYTVSRSSLAATRDATPGEGRGALPGFDFATRRLATVMVREAGGREPALPRHAADAIVSLCTVQTAASCGASGEAHSYLLSGARDGALTLWNNVE